MTARCLKRARTAAARGAAGAGSAAGTALDLDHPNEVLGADSAEVNEDDDNDADVDPLARVNELHAKIVARRKERRGKATTLRSKSSVWTTLVVVGVDKSNKAACAICGVKIALSRTPSSNIIPHHQTWHKHTAMAISKAA